jgi:hypothetical protein
MVVEALVYSLKTEGQLNPILVRTDGPKPRLVCGAHRVEAAKQIGWTNIEAKAIDLDGMSSEMADIACRIAEVDEDLVRGELDHAQRVIFLDERVLKTAERIACKKVEDEAKAHAEAQTRRTKDNAKQRLNAAVKAAAKLSGTCSGAHEHPTGRLPNGTLDTVAKELGFSTSFVRDVHSFANSLGREALSSIAGSQLGTHSEMKALIKLKKVSPSDAKKVIEGAKKGQALNRPPSYSPSGTLAEIEKRERAGVRHDALQSREGRLDLLAKELREIAAKFKHACNYWGGLPVEDKAKLDIHRARENADVLSKLANDLAKPPQQERTGHEHKYPDKKRAGPSKQQLRDELKQHGVHGAPTLN